MGVTKIEWARYTFNPWRGCTKVSAGCDHCYAERQSRRNPRVMGVWGDNGTRAMAAESYWRLPLKWNEQAAREGVRPRVFCGSLMDVFEDRPELIGPRARLFNLISETTELDWLLLTKRPENVPRLVRELRPLLNWEDQEDDLDPIQLPNVWMGISVENQALADARIPDLLKIPAAVRFLSCEPMLGPVTLPLIETMIVDSREPARGGCGYGLGGKRPNAINWVIAGGESGPHARPCHPDWIRSLRDQCQAAGVPFFFKQWGEWLEEEEAMRTVGDDACAALSKRCIVRENTIFYPVGKKCAGRTLDGREWAEVPQPAY